MIQFINDVQWADDAPCAALLSRPQLPTGARGDMIV